MVIFRANALKTFPFVIFLPFDDESLLTRFHSLAVLLVGNEDDLLDSAWIERGECGTAYEKLGNGAARAGGHARG